MQLVDFKLISTLINATADVMTILPPVYNTWFSITFENFVILCFMILVIDFYLRLKELNIFNYSNIIPSFSMTLLLLFSCIQTSFANFPIFSNLFFPNWFINYLPKSCIVVLCRLIWYESILCQLNLILTLHMLLFISQVFLILNSWISNTWLVFYACLINFSIPPYHNFLS